jgi:predicted phosphoadenosine phosphosulfate sulfurtransferase
LFIDLEGQYKLTIDHVRECYQLYAAHIDPFWICLPLHLRNAVSQYQPHWICWDNDARDNWIRPLPPEAISDETCLPFFRHGMEFEEFIEYFGDWYGKGKPTACCVGIRSDESLNRFRALAMSRSSKFEGRCWTTWKGGAVFNIYPIYDWRTEDDWIYLGKSGKPYNRLYDYMYKAGLTIHQMRICQPYGDDQRKGLWLFHLIEPETWGRIVARVSGANHGAIYIQESSNMLGNIKISKPAGHTWKSFAELLLGSMPEKTAEHFRNKIAVFLHWYAVRGYPHGIPDDGALQKGTPSWKRICKALLRNDYWCKGLSFTQHKSTAYEKYIKVMKARRQRWGIFPVG